MRSISLIHSFHFLGEQVQGFVNLWWKRSECIRATISCSGLVIFAPLFSLKSCQTECCALFMQAGFWYGKSSFSISLRLSQPQSMPVAFVKRLMTCFIPVASVSLSIESPSPADLLSMLFLM